MVDKFTVGFKPQNKWGWLAAIDFFLGGTGAGAFIISMFFGIDAGMIVGLIAVAMGALALLLDLGRLGRFWKALSRPGNSWISRGTILTIVFLIFGILYIVPEFFTGLPWSKGTGPGQAIGLVTVMGAAGVMLYTGFLLSLSSAIPFWNTALLPLLFALFALLCGAGTLFILLPFLGQPNIDIRSLQIMNIILLVFALVFIWIYILNMSYSTLASRESVRLLINGRLAWPFLILVNVFGLIIPLVISIIIYLAKVKLGPASSVLVVAGLLALLGGFYFRYSILRAGVYAPLNPMA